MIKYLKLKVLLAVKWQFRWRPGATLEEGLMINLNCHLKNFLNFFFLNFTFLLFSFSQNYFRSSFRSIFDSSGRIFLRFPSVSRHPNSHLEAKITTSLSPDLHHFQMHRGFVSILHIFSHLRILIVFIFNFLVVFRRNSDGKLNGA